jgi:hypothetical protein
MDRIAVASRDLAIVGYDSSAHAMEITFRRGGVYEYRGVPEEVYRALMNADSLGTYFRDFIKDKYPCEKIR